MERFNVENENWMIDILDYYEKTIPAAKQGFYQDDEDQPWLKLYESPEIEHIRLYFGDFSICDENTVIENRFELMEYIQKLVKSEITAPDLELLTGFEYREYQGSDLKKKPVKSFIVMAEWDQI